MKRRQDERGASLIEYALLLALVAMVAVGAVTFLGGSVDKSLQVDIGATTTTTP
jgi:Flp pilus assembly pilin Flp